MNIVSETQQSNTNANRVAVSNEQKEDYMTVKSNSEVPNENTTHTRYGRLVKRLDR